MNEKRLICAILVFVSAYLSTRLMIDFVLPAAILKINCILNTLKSAGVDVRFLWLSLVAAVVGYVCSRL